jgi:hypothetical protein
MEKKYTESDIQIARQEAFNEGKEIGYDNGWKDAKDFIIKILTDKGVDNE